MKPLISFIASLFGVRPHDISKPTKIEKLVLDCVVANIAEEWRCAATKQVESIKFFHREESGCVVNLEYDAECVLPLFPCQAEDFDLSEIFLRCRETGHCANAVVSIENGRLSCITFNAPPDDLILSCVNVESCVFSPFTIAERKDKV